MTTSLGVPDVATLNNMGRLQFTLQTNFPASILLYRRPILPRPADVPALTDTAGADSDLSPYGIAIVIIQYTDNGGPSQAGNVA